MQNKTKVQTTEQTLKNVQGSKCPSLNKRGQQHSLENNDVLQLWSFSTPLQTTAAAHDQKSLLCFQAEIEEVGEEAPHQTNPCRRYLTRPTHSRWACVIFLVALPQTHFHHFVRPFVETETLKNEHNWFVLNEREEYLVTLELIETWTKAQHVGEVVHQVN